MGIDAPSVMARTWRVFVQPYAIFVFALLGETQRSASREIIAYEQYVITHLIIYLVDSLRNSFLI